MFWAGLAIGMVVGVLLVVMVAAFILAGEADDRVGEWESKQGRIGAADRDRQRQSRQRVAGVGCGNKEH